MRTLGCAVLALVVFVGGNWAAADQHKKRDDPKGDAPKAEKKCDKDCSACKDGTCPYLKKGEKSGPDGKCPVKRDCQGKTDRKDSKRGDSHHKGHGDRSKRDGDRSDRDHHRGHWGSEARGEWLQELKKKMDKDGDGEVSEKEKEAFREDMKKKFAERMEAWKKETLQKYDADKDGKLSDEEKKAMFESLKKQHQEKMKERMAEAPARMAEGALRMQDKNDDGKLNADEVTKEGRERFNHMDKNQDGYLDKAEIEAEMKGRLEKMRAEWQKRREAWQQKAKEAREKRETPDKDAPQKPTAEDLLKADKNGDGKLNADEAPARLRHSFGKIDADHDGYLSKDELEAILKK